MRAKYNIYPEARKIIKENGIEKRVQELKKKDDGLPYMGGFVYEEEIARDVKYLIDEGYYTHLPQDFSKTYKQTMNAILKNPKSFNWNIKKPTGNIIEPCEIEDLNIFTGIAASYVLSADELWDYKRFGFSSPTELVGITSAYIIEQSHGSGDYREGYKWTRKLPDGSEIVNQITGDHNSDLRIYQTDIAPYDTIDPFGNSIRMRPQVSNDRHVVSAYHSTEPALLIAVMKYIEQQKINTSIFSNNAKDLIDWGKTLGQGGGTCAEHFGGMDQNPRMFFMSYDVPLAKLDKDGSTSQHCFDWLFCSSETAYGAYIDHAGNLVFSYRPNSMMREPHKIISARFAPEDAEDLIKGVIYQSAKGLGRTSAKQMLDIIQYRFSNDFKKDWQDK